ncbi:MAG: hypothetical protein DMG55_15995 [Acidobacteria bacterium]|nr:MAG: hypothetical protein DMG55_15995 [Acidobacteriota bacterium]
MACPFGALSAGKSSALIPPWAKAARGCISSPAAAWPFSWPSPARASKTWITCPFRNSSRAVAAPCCSWAWPSSWLRWSKKLFSAVIFIRSLPANNAGADPLRATRFGTLVGIFITGILFGLMHGAQLGWTWGLVSLLTLVGVIFTFARAWTGTVLASFLLHLGYNSMIAVTSIIATRGFTHLPPQP